MTGPGAPRRGRHASPDDGRAGLPTSEFAFPARSIPVQRAEGAGQPPVAGAEVPGRRDRGWTGTGWTGSGSWLPPVPVVQAASPATRPGPVPAGHVLEAPAAAAVGAAAALPQARHRGFGEDADRAGETGPVPAAEGPSVPSSAGSSAAGGGGSHPSGPLPPFPSSAWSRLAGRRGEGREDTAGPHADPAADDETQATAVADHHDWDATGGLDVLGAHDDGHHDDGHHDDGHHDDGHHDDGHPDDVHPDDVHPDDLHPDDLHDAHPDDGPLALADAAPRDGRGRRRRRRRIAVVVALFVLAGLAVGVVLGGRQILGMVHPPDYTGSGTGTVQIRVQEGDTLKAIGQTMVDQGVIASVRPFVDAAAKNPQATGISPGTYALRSHMSGQAALDMLLQPSARLVSRVTLPEGLTAAVTLQKVAQATRVPLAQLQAAAADPASLGLPAYAGGKAEGFLFPATYDFEPNTTPNQMLQAMVDRTQKTLDALAVPQDQRLKVLTEASIVQAEGKTPDDMAKIARVLDNRLAIGMPLQLDTTVNYANGKNGVTTTPQDRANPSPYNTYAHPGLPPGPIGNPGEEAIRAVLSPAQGTWLYFVVIDPDTGETRFATTAQEAQANTALFQQWLREHPGR